MPFKINISQTDGKTYKVESDSEALIGKELHEKISGSDVNSDLEGYEFEIRGTSDKAGFTSMPNAEGVGLSRQLLTYGKGMNKKPRGGKKKVQNNRPKGLRLRKTVSGKVISLDMSQINLKVLKEGSKKLSEIFPDQNKKEEAPKKETEESPAAKEKPVDEKKE